MNVEAATLEGYWARNPWVDGEPGGAKLPVGIVKRPHRRSSAMLATNTSISDMTVDTRYIDLIDT